MIISEIRRWDEGASAVGWSGLRRFRNVGFTSNLIASLQAVPSGERRNIRKQAEQIKDCLVQAEEYFAAARSVTLAIKPVLIYYGIMSLALAELLLKQDGRVSLDMARAKHAHHGLDFKVAGDPSKLMTLSESASLLRAVPFIKSEGQRYGTFELWHRSAREAPLAAKVIVIENGIQRETVSVAALPLDKQMPALEESGVNLLQCLRHVPGVAGLLQEYGESSLLCRASAHGLQNKEENVRTVQLIVHPTPHYEAFKNKFVAPLSSLPFVKINDLGAGFDIRHTASLEATESFPLPNSFQENERFLFLCLDNQSLNEFGLYYVISFMLGNYARYYPDFWMRDLDNGSDLAQIASRILEIIEARAAVLAYGEFSRKTTILS